MNKIYALVIVTGLLLSGSEWCYGQNVASGESAAQGKMREKTKSDLATEKIQEKQQTNTVLSPETETIKKSEPDNLMKTKSEYSHKREAGTVKVERIINSDQSVQKKEKKELVETRGSQKKYNTYKVHKVQETDGPKKMRRNQNSTIEQKK